VYRMYAGQPQAADKIARLIVPNAIDVYSIDGKVVYDFMLKSGKSEVQLLPGQHNIVARYNAIWNEGMEGHEAVKSGLVGMSFEARAGRLYQVAFPEPQDVDSAEKFADNVKLWIEDIQPKAAPVGAPTWPAEAVSRRGLAAPSSVSNTVAAAKSEPAIVSVPDVTNAAAAKPSAAESLPLQNLKFWWRKADEQDRRQFREWAPANSAPCN